MKKIAFNSKPTHFPGHSASDSWVTERLTVAEPQRRLTFDVPMSLHQKVKSQCALNGEKMSDVLREIVERHFGNDSAVKQSSASIAAVSETENVSL